MGPGWGKLAERGTDYDLRDVNVNVNVNVYVDGCIGNAPVYAQTSAKPPYTLTYTLTLTLTSVQSVQSVFGKRGSAVMRSICRRCLCVCTTNVINASPTLMRIHLAAGELSFVRRKFLPSAPCTKPISCSRTWMYASSTSARASGPGRQRGGVVILVLLSGSCERI